MKDNDNDDDDQHPDSNGEQHKGMHLVGVTEMDIAWSSPLRKCDGFACMTERSYNLEWNLSHHAWVPSLQKRTAFTVRVAAGCSSAISASARRW